MATGDFVDPPHRLRVRYCETDRMGVAHHGSYVAWFEEARTEWLRRRGKTYRQMEDEGALLQVVEFAASYKRPIDYDDEILIFTRVQERTKVAVTLEYRVERADTRELAATGSTRLACVSRDGRLRGASLWLGRPLRRQEQSRNQ
jgi:acyl-CoA thioester hydrolase